MDFIVTFLEGLISFISPCMLPLLPLYISYFSDETEVKKESGEEGGISSIKTHYNLTTVIRTLYFILGFSTVFCTLGILAGTIGQTIGKYKNILNIICGIVIIFFGLTYIGIIKLNFLKGSKRAKKITSFWSAFVFGIIYSFSLTPCIGAMLGSALALACVSATRTKGFLLLLSYCLGLALPFIVSSIMIEKLKSVFSKIKKHYDIINIISGLFLIIIGAFIIFKGSLSVIKEYENTDINQSLKVIEKVEYKEETTMSELKITKDNFEELVMNNDKAVLLDFWASWCPPCRMLEPIIKDIEKMYNNKLVIGKVNVDEEAMLSAKFGITSIPTLILFKNGQIQKVRLGYASKETLIKEFELENL